MRTNKEIRLANARNLAKKKGSLSLFARLLDKSESQISQIIGETPIRGIGNKIAREIEDACKKPRGWLDVDHSSNVSEIKSDERLVPLISMVQAGSWSEATDPYSLGDAVKFLPHPGKGGNNIYALKVEGDSMVNLNGGHPSFRPGVIIYVDPEQIEPTHGACVIARIKGGYETTFKRLSMLDGAPKIKPINKHYDDITEEFEIIGTVIASTTYY